MPKASDKPATALGFLTVVRHETHGLFGGYLLVNAQGRPLEFHCTAPVKPNRAQEILFGPTLESYLYGEQIGQALVTKAGVPVNLIVTDIEQALAVREHVETPVAYIAVPRAGGESQHRIDPPQAAIAGGHWLEIGARRLALVDAGTEQQALVRRVLDDLPDHFDLAEPFGRIHEAIEEAQRSGR